MAQRCPGNGLIVAGVIVTLVGLSVVVTRAYQLPREWTTVAVGLALLVAGVAWRMLRRPDAS